MVPRIKHIADPDQLLTRGRCARRSHFRCIDVLPVAKGYDVQIFGSDQFVETCAPALAATCRPLPVAIGNDALRDRRAIGLVRADRPRRPSPRPADAIETGQDQPVAVGKAAPAIAAKPVT